VSGELTLKELKLLQFFSAHPGEVLSRDRLLNEVWGYNYFGTTRTLDQVVVQLRRSSATTAASPNICSPSMAWVTTAAVNGGQTQVYFWSRIARSPDR